MPDQVDKKIFGNLKPVKLVLVVSNDLIWKAIHAGLVLKSI